MGIPLNIDWQQMLLHLLNFVVLAGGLYLLLYSPVKNFMKKRTAFYKDMDDKAKEKIAEAEALKSDYQKLMDNAETEIEQKKAEALKQAEMAAAEQIEKAKVKSEKIISDTKKAAQFEYNKIISDAQTEIAKFAILATEKLLSKATAGTLDDFLDSVNKE